MRTCLDQLDYEQCDLFRRLTREFASAKTNAIEKYGEDLEKKKKKKKKR